MPLSVMSEASSGGVSSSVALVASMISTIGASIARRTSSLDTSASRGRPVTGSRPRTCVTSGTSSSMQQPTSSFTRSAVTSPIARPQLARTQTAIASSRS